MITVEWLDETKKVIRCQLSSNWTWEEFYEAQQKVDAMIDTVDGIVDTIIISTHEQYLPPSALSHLRKITLQRHKRYGLSFVVGSQSFVQALLDVLGRVLPHDDIINFVNTEEEALEHIRKTQQKRIDQSTSVA